MMALNFKNCVNIMRVDALYTKPCFKIPSVFESTCIHEQLFSDIKCIVANIAPY